ncbi:hypothetical protein T12_5090 [Trichinella patagoniensis]|uniref:Uncharacterized protein n=1 Tax=Trichinella patagoniensis TaxID=990121 RepID=A0A0V0ZFB3_9BILA|nr:hypothetical protein T12_5090 [Trichinella patagoniensis]
MYLPKAAFSQMGLWGTLGFREQCPGVLRNIVTSANYMKKVLKKKHLKNYAKVPRDKNYM